MSDDEFTLAWVLDWRISTKEPRTSVRGVTGNQVMDPGVNVL